MNQLEIIYVEIGIPVRQTHRIHPEDLMNASPLVEGVLSVALIAIFWCVLALLRLLS